MIRLFGIPSLAASATLILTAIFNQPAMAVETKNIAEDSSKGKPFQVQVVGVQWLNPLVRRDYPTEWQLLWTLGLAKPNKNDEKVRDKPEKFTSVQPISGVAFNINRRNTIAGFLDQYLVKTFQPIGRGYIMDSSYFYSIHSEKKREWRELHGIRVHL